MDFYSKRATVLVFILVWYERNVKALPNPQKHSSISLSSHQISCNKTQFVKNSANKGILLSDSDYKTLRACQPMKCNKQRPEVSVTYAEDQQGKLWMIFDAFNLTKKGCWGYAVQTEIDSKPQTLFFNFNSNAKYFQYFLYVQLGTKYNFTTTALPNGGSSTMITVSPSVCELEVIEAIYYKIQKKEIFVGCSSPDYIARKAIAGEICKRFPDNPLARMAYTKKNLIEVGCKFKLQHSNNIKQTVRL